MTVAILRLELRVGNCYTHREKRRRMQAIVSKLHRHFNVSVAERDGETDPALALLVVAAVAKNRRDAREVLERVADAVAAYPRAEIMSQLITET